MERQNLDPQEIWQAAKGALQLQMTRANFDEWVKDARLLTAEENSFIVGVPNFYVRDWLQARLHPMIKRTLEGIVGHAVELRYTVQQKPHRTKELAPGPNMLWPDNGGSDKLPQGIVLNPRYTFERFIVGSGNRMAHAAALAIAERPGYTYNPLFLHGGVGLGKTHLLQAVGHEAMRRGYKILYVSSETFTNDLINAIRTQSTAAFRERYRTVDVLLIDDIQFIAGKETTQEEFFHTFNTLYAANKQICITSDRHPREMVSLQERLVSRFQGGILTDVRPPDYETRLAILRARAGDVQIPFPEEVLDFVARKVETNIRELEGAFNRLVAHARLDKAPLAVEVAAEILRDIAPVIPTVIDPAQLIRVVARHYSLSEDDLKGPSRSRQIVTARHIAMFLLREETSLSLPQIGQLLGGRDHTTVMHGYNKIKNALLQDSALQHQIMRIQQILQQRVPAME